MLMAEIIAGIAEVIVFLVLTVFIYKLADILFKQNRHLGIVIIRVISIFLLIDGLCRTFQMRL